MVAPPGEHTKQHTLPFALCFKKLISSDVFCTLIEQCQDLLQVREVYFGGDNKVMHVVPIIKVVANNMPERCENTHTCFKGTYIPRFMGSPVMLASLMLQSASNVKSKSYPPIFIHDVCQSKIVDNVPCLGHLVACRRKMRNFCVM